MWVRLLSPARWCLHVGARPSASASVLRRRLSRRLVPHRRCGGRPVDRVRDGADLVTSSAPLARPHLKDRHETGRARRLLKNPRGVMR